MYSFVSLSIVSVVEDGSVGETVSVNNGGQCEGFGLQPDNGPKFYDPLKMV